MLSVIIISYNTHKITLKCLRHVFASHLLQLEVIVVDNNSTDKSVTAIKKEFPQVTLIENKTNRGFGSANNQGMQIASGEYFLLLNSDAFVKPDTVARCLSFLDKNPTIGIVGCKLVNPDGSFQISMGYFPSLLRVAGLMLFSASTLHVKNPAEYVESKIVDWVTGAFMLVRKEVFTKTGGFDERFFLYGEELEWQYRTFRAGFSTAYFAGATTTHLGGASSKDKSKMFLGEMLGYLRWFTKYGQPWEQLLIPHLLRAGCFLRVIAFSVLRKPGLVKAYVSVLSSWPTK